VSEILLEVGLIGWQVHPVDQQLHEFSFGFGRAAWNVVYPDQLHPFRFIFLVIDFTCDLLFLGFGVFFFGVFGVFFFGVFGVFFYFLCFFWNFLLLIEFIYVKFHFWVILMNFFEFIHSF